MKRLSIALALAGAASAVWATDIGVSVEVNQPGLYGRVDIGRVSTPPAVIYTQPVVVAPPRVVVQQQPVYLHVPPGHAKDWRKHCGKYNACGQPVYFVQEGWYQQQYVPAVHGGGKNKDRGDHHGRGRGKGHGKDD
jgi:hypothetical protein